MIYYIKHLIKTLCDILYFKWIKGNCRMLCFNCQFSETCFEQLKEELKEERNKRNEK